MSTAITSSLQPTAADTPLDARTVVAALADIPDIQMPFVGMIIYVKATAKHYKVTSLKSKTIGAITVPNAQVDVFEELAPSGSGSELPSGGTAGQVLTKTEQGEKWQDIPSELPSGGTAGQVLTKTAQGEEWQDAPSGGSSAAPDECILNAITYGG